MGLSKSKKIIIKFKCDSNHTICEIKKSKTKWFMEFEKDSPYFDMDFYSYKDALYDINGMREGYEKEQIYSLSNLWK